MKKWQYWTVFILVLCVFCCKKKNSKHILKQHKATPKEQWKLVWEEEFNGSELDTTRWSFCPASEADCFKHMSPNKKSFKIKNGKIYLKGIVNPDTIKDKKPFLTSGIWTKDKLEFLYGKIEIRAKMQSAKGSWPAIWLLQDKEYNISNQEQNKNDSIKKRTYPKNYAEIDILEHLNFEENIYQTVHTYYSLELKKLHPKKYETPKVDVHKFNTYGIEWFRDKIIFTINGKNTFEYPKIDGTHKSQWPFENPLFIILSQQLGGSWVGDVNSEDLPTELVIDWVKIYQ